MKLTPGQEAEVIKTMELYATAYQNKDIETLSAILSPEITGFGSGPDEVIRDHQDFIEHTRRDLSQASILSVVFNDSSINGYGTVAWVTSQTDMTFTTDGKTKQLLQGRSTMVLRNTGNNYVIEQLHFSLPCAAQSEGQSFPGT